VSDTLNPARRWNSFVCPGCRFVFRVPRDHDGKGVVCPACRIMLRLPGAEDAPPPLLSPTRDGTGDLPEEIETEDEGDFPAGPGRGDLRFLLGLALPALVLLGLFAWWMLPDPSKPPVAVASPAAAPPRPAEVAAVPPVKTLIGEVESVVKGFLEAPTPEDMLRHVRDPERIAPMLKVRLGGEPFAAPGFREILADSVTTTGGGSILSVKVRTGDFELREIVLLGGEGNLKVDWESWVGWSEMPWEDFQRERPVDGKWFRVTLSRVVYYNFAFKDETEWVSYRLDSPEGKNSLYGYVARASALDERIRPIDENGKVKLLLKLKFPPDAAAGNQVIIDAVSGHEWVDQADPANP
jgi:hypothetical protein